jgi:hypothetical protein
VDAVADVVTYVLAGDACVVKIRGDLDDDAVEQVAQHGHATVVDLDVLDALVAGSGDAVFTADRPLLDALELIALRRPVQTAPSLAAALA